MCIKQKIYIFFLNMIFIIYKFIFFFWIWYSCNFGWFLCEITTPGSASWSGSGSIEMKRIRADPVPQLCIQFQIPGQAQPVPQQQPAQDRPASAPGPPKLCQTQAIPRHGARRDRERRTCSLFRYKAFYISYTKSLLEIKKGINKWH